MVLPNAQSCQTKSIGVCSNGTRKGITMTNSKSNPKSKGMTPNKTLKATKDFNPQIHHRRIFSKMAALP